MNKGIVAVIMASILYGIMPSIIKLVLNEGITSSSVVFYRFLFAWIFALVILKIRKTSIKVNKKQLFSMAFFGTVGFGMTSALLASAYNYIPTGLATMIHFSYPLFVTLAMFIVFKEKLSIEKIFSCIFAILGIMCMADFKMLNPTGILLALLAGVTYAIYVIANKKSSIANLDALVVIFYVNLFASVIFGSKAILTNEFMFIPNIKVLFLIGSVSLFCTVFSLFLLTYGVRTLGATKASVLNMLEPITSVIIGVLLYKEILSFKSAVGCLFIVASSIIITLKVKNKSLQSN